VLVGALTLAGSPVAQAYRSVPVRPSYSPLTLYAYVEAGETLSASATNTLDTGVTVTSPLGEVTQGQGKRAAIATSGIWRIDFVGDPAQIKYEWIELDWNVEVLRGLKAKSGRVFAHLYRILQKDNSVDDTTLTFWGVTPSGYIYQARFDDFNGVASTLAMDAVGNRVGTSCQPAYASTNVVPADPGFCSPSYKIFFEAPDPAMPAEALTATGSDWLLPPVRTASAITVDNLAFRPIAPDQAAGTFSFDLTGFAGSYALQIDTNNNGVYDEAQDRTINLWGAPGHVDQVFDGRDGRGQVLPPGTEFTARVFFDYATEIHVVQWDAEGRDGIRLTRLNGEGAPDYTVYWNDADITGEPGYQTPIVDGRAGYNSLSANGIHGWKRASQGSWGDNSSIDDWAFGPALQFEAASLTVRWPKSASPVSGTAVTPGETITYTLHFANDGAAALPLDAFDDLSGVLDDADLTSAPVASAPTVIVGALGPDGRLPLSGSVPPGGADVTYQVTVKLFGGQGDHTVTNAFQCPTASRFCQPSTTSHPIAHLALEIRPAVSGPGTYTAGDTIAYRYAVSNDGAVPVSSIAIQTDAFTGGSLDAITCPTVTLAPGAALACNTQYVVAQADVDAGDLLNRAVAVGRLADGRTVASALATATAQSGGLPGLTVTASARVEGSGPLTPGRVVTYTLEAINSGSVTLQDVTLIDEDFTGLGALGTLTYAWPGQAGLLTPGQSVTATATYAMTQGDIDAGDLGNGARVRGVDPTGTEVEATDAVVVLADRAPNLELTKTAETVALSSPPVPGETVTYSYTLGNTGNVTLYDLTASDPLPGLSPLTWDWPGTEGMLAPGQAATMTATYHLTQGDLDAGQVASTATAQAVPPDGSPILLPVTATHNLPLGASAGLTVGQTVDASGLSVVPRVGDPLTYAFVALNTGSMTLRSVMISDSLPGLTPLDYTWPDPTHPGVVGPGQVVSARATYRLTQADIDAGEVMATALAGAASPANELVEAAAVTTRAAVTQVPQLTLAKQAETSAIAHPAAVGNAVAYQFTVTNTGNTTLAGITVTDPLPGLAALRYRWPSVAGVLRPGQSVVADSTYRLTQADLDAGHVASQAQVTGRAPNQTLIEAAAETDTGLTTAGQLTVTATADTSGLSSPVRVGDRLTYTVTATNTGTARLTTVALTDPMPGLTAWVVNWPGAPGALEVGATLTALASTSISQDALDAGHVTNAVQVRGQLPDGEVVSGTAGPDTPLAVAGGLTFTEVANTSGLNNPVQVGDQITYAYTATNAGTARLVDVAITHDPQGDAPLTYTWPGPAGVLGVGQTMTASVGFVVSQADLDAGAVVHGAIIRGTLPDGRVIMSAADTTTPLESAGHLTVTQTVDASALQSPARVGDTIAYGFRIANASTAKVHGLTFENNLAGLGELAYTWPGPVGELGVGQAVTATAAYQVTQGDLDRGSVTSLARASGILPRGIVVDGESTTTTKFTTTGQWRLSQVADTSAVHSPVRVGDRIQLAVQATNTGTAGMTAGSVGGFSPDLVDVTVRWPDPTQPGLVSVGQSVTASGHYDVTQADLDAGRIVSRVEVVGVLSGGDPVAATDHMDIDLETIRSLDLTLRAQPALHQPTLVGDTITYTLDLTNSGTVTLTQVRLTDLLPGLSTLSFTWPGAIGQLRPGDTVTASATYAIAQADLNAGHIAHSALALAVAADGRTVSAGASTDTPLTAGSGFLFTKTADLQAVHSPALVGDRVTYTLTAVNTGTARLTGVAFSDPLPGLTRLIYTWPGPVGELDVGQTVVASATYGLNQADLETGSIRNTATIRGTLPQGQVAQATTETTVPLEVLGRVDIVLAAERSGVHVPARVGDTIVYRAAATNVGTTRLTDIRLTDVLPRSADFTYRWPGPVGQLEPGQTVTAQSTVALTQADLDARVISNVVTVRGQSIRGGAVEATADLDIWLEATGRLTLQATADASRVQAPARPGDPITYSFVAANAGTVRLIDVELVDALRFNSVTYNWPTSAGELDIGETVTATAVYRLTQADLDAGHILNDTTFRGAVPFGDRVAATGHTDLRLQAAGAWTFTKAADLTGMHTPIRVGDTIRYEYKAVNTGTAKLTGVAVVDSESSLTEITYAWPGQPGEVPVGASVTATTTYRVTQADLDSGHVAGAATIQGRLPNGTTVTAAGATDVPLATAAELILTQTVDTVGLRSPARLGDPLVFNFTATNRGNIPLTEVEIIDILPGLSELVYNWPGPVGELAAGQTVAATAVYHVTQGDLDAGAVANAAAARGKTSGGGTIQGGSSNTTSLEAMSDLALVKTADTTAVGSPARIGDVITYTFTVTNAGTARVRNVTLQDSLRGLTPPTYDWPGTPDEVGVGETLTVTATYRLTQVDLDQGKIESTTVVQGRLPHGERAQVTQESTTSFVVNGQWALVAAADSSGLDSPVQAGDEIVYRIVATNAGTARMIHVEIVDPWPSLGTLEYRWPDPAFPHALGVGETVTASVRYALQQSDLDAGRIASRIEVRGVLPDGDTVTARQDIEVPIDAAGQLKLTQSVEAPPPTDPPLVGDEIAHAFTFTNVGNAQLVGIQLVDLKPTLTGLTYDWPDPSQPGVLGAGQTATAVAVHAVTQADLDAGHLASSAIVRGERPVTGEFAEAAGFTDTVLTPDVKWVLTMWADQSQVYSPAEVGDPIGFVLTAANGTADDIAGVSFTGPLIDQLDLAYEWPDPTRPGVVPVGMIVKATATYRVSEADLLTERVLNVAVVRGALSDGATVAGTGQVTVAFPVLPANGGGTPSTFMAMAVALILLGFILRFLAGFERREPV
jgi:uncharacterized repeat protein (TIGR01451 family)